MTLRKSPLSGTWPAGSNTTLPIPNDSSRAIESGCGSPSQIIHLAGCSFMLNVDRRIEEIVNRKRVQPLLAPHPVYDYFARRYGLNIRSVLWEPEIVPNARQWAELENIIKEHPAKWMIWEGDPHPDLIARLESLGCGWPSRPGLIFNRRSNRPRLYATP